MANEKAKAQEPDVKALRAFIKPQPMQAVNDDALMSGGHNLIIDRRDPTELVLRIGLDDTCFAEMFTPPKAGGGEGAPVLAKAQHGNSRFGSVPLKIRGEMFWLNLALTKAKKGA